MRNICAILITAACVVAPPAYAHHSAAMFDRTSTRTLEGTVNRIDWANPHVYLFIEARDGSGQPAEWQLEGDSTAIMTRDGWTPTTLAPGAPVSVRMNPDRNAQRNHGLLLSVLKEDGVLLTRRSGGRASTVGATGLSGVWDALRNDSPERVRLGTPTEKGEAALREYTESVYPAANCIPYATPHIIALAPYLNAIDVREDSVVIRSEFFDVVRTIYTDGRGHPENAERSNQGHSIGAWEGDILVVDTTLFTDDRSGNLRGIPSGAQKHVVERYALSADRKQMTIEYVVEDPEYLSSPTTGTSVWDYAPDRELLPFGCNPENASLYFLK